MHEKIEFLISLGLTKAAIQRLSTIPRNSFERWYTNNLPLSEDNEYKLKRFLTNFKKQVEENL